jgi:hypothetical protein
VRFFEFQNKDLESALVNVLIQHEGRRGREGQSSEISMDAVAGIMNNTGYPAFNYDVFKRMYDDG